MTKKNKIYITVTGLMAVTLIWLSQVNKNSELKDILSDEKTTDNNSVSPITSLEGTLWVSNDQSKGNLMLQSKYALIYLKTSRDFNNLIGKNVLVSTEGTLENFTLLNIEEKITKDGFIQIQ